MFLIVLNSTQLLLLFIAFVSIVIGVIYLNKFLINKNALQDTDKTMSSPYDKKYSFANIFQNRSPFVLTGLFLTITFTALAFNYTTMVVKEAPRNVVKPIGGSEQIADIPNTDFEELVIQDVIPEDVEIELVETEEEIKEEKSEVKPIVNPTTSTTTGTAGTAGGTGGTGGPKGPEKPAEEPEDNTVYQRVDNDALFEGSCGAEANKMLIKKCDQTSLINWIASNLEYPMIAQEQGLEGKALIQFVVNKQGKVINISVKKSSGHEILDKAALKIMQTLASKKSWSPAKMGIKPVNQAFNVPIIFNLD